MKKNILFISRHYFPVMGGIEQNIFKISSFLKKDFNIDILTCFIEGLPLMEINDGVTILRKKNIEFLFFDYSKYDSTLIENFNIMPHFFVCIKIMYLKIFRKVNTKIIFVPHGGFTTGGPQFSKIQKIIKKIYNDFFGLIFINNCVNKVIGVSKWEIDRLEKVGIKKPIILISNGIDLTSTSMSVKENYFIFVGRIDSIKNIEEIIKTFAIITQNNDFQSYKLKIVGDYKANMNYFNSLLLLIKELNLEDKIEFLGEYKNEKKETLISKAQCLFCLSLEESDSIVIKEAFALKTKVLINLNGALRDYQFEKNVFVKAKNNFDIREFKEFVDLPFEEDFLNSLLSWEQVSNSYKNIILL